LCHRGRNSGQDVQAGTDQDQKRRLHPIRKAPGLFQAIDDKHAFVPRHALVGLAGG
jgi:hypothetical protein